MLIICNLSLVGIPFASILFCKFCTYYTYGMSREGLEETFSLLHYNPFRHSKIKRPFADARKIRDSSTQKCYARLNMDNLRFSKCPETIMYEVKH
jgi:hypothetical protein